VQFSFVLVFL